MRKQLQIIGLFALQGLLAFQSFGQCPSASWTVNETFSTNTGQDPPSCWFVEPSNNVFDFTNGDARFSSSNRYLILPNVQNTKGTLTFKATHDNNNTYGGMTFSVGIWDGANFTVLGTGNYGIPGWQSFSYDFSSNTANGSIAISPNGNTSINLAIDDIVYQAQCINSDSVVMVTEPVTLKLDASGILIANPADIDNGSTKSCGTPITNLSLDNSLFTCANLGENKVVLTADDDNGHTKSDTVIVTIEPTIATYGPYRYLDSSGSYVITEENFINATTSTSCPDVTYSFEPDSFDCTDHGSVQYVVTSAVYGTDTAKQTTTVYPDDQIGATVIVEDLEFTIDVVTGQVVLTPELLDAGTFDACGILDWSIDESVFTCTEVGSHQVTLTVRDSSYNTTTGTATVMINSFVPEQSLTIADDSYCFNGDSTSTQVELDGSMSGVNYYLLDADSVYLDTLTGTGSPIAFEVNDIAENSSYIVYSEVVDNGQALYLPGSEDHLNVVAPGSFDYSGGYTLSAWIKAGWTNSTNAYEPIFSIGNSTSCDVEIYVGNNTSQLTLVHNRDNSGTLDYEYSALLPTDGEYFHLAVTYDAPSQVIRVFVNGVQTFAVGNFLAPLRTGGSEIVFGELTRNTFASSQNYFDGYIDDIRVYDVARTGAEILSDMSRCLVGDEDDLVLYFPLDEATGTIVFDQVSNTPGQIISSAGVSAELNEMNAISCDFTCDQWIDTTVSIGDYEAPNVVGKDTILILNVLNKGAADPVLATLSGEDINIGSTDNCAASEDLTYTLSQTDFTVGDTGVHVLTLYVEDLNGNIDSSSVTLTVFEYAPVGVNELISADDLSVYPNPNNGTVNLRLASGAISVVKVWNTRGELVEILETTNASEVQFNLKNEPGVYLLEVQSDNRVGRLKMILE
jgi:hypothetical protein